jgi:hypothetical protein
MKLISLPKLPNLEGLFKFLNILSLFKLNTIKSLLNQLRNKLNLKVVPFILIAVVLYIVLNHLLSRARKVIVNKPIRSKSSSFPKKRYNKLETVSFCDSTSLSSCSLSSSRYSSNKSEVKKCKKDKCSLKLNKKQIENTLRKF